MFSKETILSVSKLLEDEFKHISDMFRDVKWFHNENLNNNKDVAPEHNIILALGRAKNAICFAENVLLQESSFQSAAPLRIKHQSEGKKSDESTTGLEDENEITVEC